MKKQYTVPKMNIVEVNHSEIICASVNFGPGTTNEMNSRGSRNEFDEEDDF